MHRRLHYLIAALAGFVALLSSQPAAQAEDQHPVFVAPGFHFDQIDSICVMPPIDARNNATHVDLSGLRPNLMSVVLDKGYRLLDPGCSGNSGVNAPQLTKTRWILTVRLDDLEASRAEPGLGVGSYLTASLFDQQAGKEVWRDSAKTGYGGRFANALVGINTIANLVESAFGSVLAKFERKKKPSPLSQADMWAPISLLVRLAKGTAFRRRAMASSGLIPEF